MQNTQDITATLSTDLKFLIACCQMEPSADDITFIYSYLNAEDFHINALIDLAYQHAILPLVYKTLLALNADTPVSKEQEGCKKLNDASNSPLNPQILTELKAHYMHISQRNMLMSAELIRIMKLLEDNDIEALAFKGPTLAQLVYGDITLRQYIDLDILVDESDLRKTGLLLDNHAYIPSFPIKILKNETCLSVINDLSFHNQTNSVFIELHWKLFREKIGKHLSFKKIAHNKQTEKINGKSLNTLSSEMLLVYLCLHGAKHAWERIEWISDIDRLVRSQTYLDWGKTIAISKEMDTLVTLYLGLALSHTLFRTPLPKNIIADLQTKHTKALISKTFKLLSGILSENESYAKYSAIHMYQMNLLDTKIKKLNHLFTTYFGISRNDCQEFPLPSSLKFLYIFIKPLRVIYKYLKFKK